VNGSKKKAGASQGMRLDSFCLFWQRAQSHCHWHWLTGCRLEARSGGASGLRPAPASWRILPPAPAPAAPLISDLSQAGSVGHTECRWAMGASEAEAETGSEVRRPAAGGE
jgi:hypothetical protein